MLEDALRPLLDAVRVPTTWSRVTLRRRALLEGEAWERLVAEPVALSRGLSVRVVETAGSRTKTRIVAAERWPAEAASLLAERLDHASVLGEHADLHARRTRRGAWQVGRGKPSRPPVPVAHDRAPSRALPLDHPDVQAFLRVAGLAGAAGKVLASRQDKHRQVQRFVELAADLPVWREAEAAGRPLRVVDAGCGRAILALALATYGRVRGVAVELTGVDTNAELLAQVRDGAEALALSARFETGTVASWAERQAPGAVDLLVALHACDTATDEALAAGVGLGARALMLAPCCHKELARLMSEPAGLAALVRHGVLRSRLAELATDALRAAALEVVGYRAEVGEFVASEHTARNVMLRAVRRLPGERGRGDALARYRELAAAIGAEPCTRALLGSAWPVEGG